MVSRTLAWGAAQTNVFPVPGHIHVKCAHHGCHWYHNFFPHPESGVSMDDIILEMNMHASKEH